MYLCTDRNREKLLESLACTEERARKAEQRAKEAEAQLKEAKARVAELEKENDQLWLLPPYVAKQPDGTKANALDLNSLHYVT